jgi:hypothetical protein
MQIKRVIIVAILAICFSNVQSQRPYTASFVATLGIDTVMVETYSMVNNYIYGKAFIRYPEDYIGVFSLHFYPDGSIRTFDIEAMHPENSSIPFETKGLFGYRQSMLCQYDTCVWYAAWPGGKQEYVHKHPARHMDFIGGWTPILSLIEWQCMRLAKTGKQHLPLMLINDYIGTRPIGISRGANDTMIFGGPFLEYAKVNTTPEGRMTKYDGTGTPWGFRVTKMPPINIDEVAERMSKKPAIGIPSPEVEVHFNVGHSNIDVSYGRPSKRGRTIFGGVVPYDSIWRTGASHPTKITLEHDIQINETIITKGAYSLYTIPRKEANWTLIFNTDLIQWPTDPNRSKDFKQVPLKVRKPAKITEQFTIDIEETTDGGILKFTWDDTEASAKFKILRN